MRLTDLVFCRRRRISDCNDGRVSFQTTRITKNVDGLCTAQGQASLAGQQLLLLLTLGTSPGGLLILSFKAWLPRAVPGQQTWCEEGSIYVPNDPICIANCPPLSVVRPCQQSGGRPRGSRAWHALPPRRPQRPRVSVRGMCAP